MKKINECIEFLVLLDLLTPKGKYLYKSLIISLLKGVNFGVNLGQFGFYLTLFMAPASIFYSILTGYINSCISVVYRAFLTFWRHLASNHAFEIDAVYLIDRLMLTKKASKGQVLAETFTVEFLIF